MPVAVLYEDRRGDDNAFGLHDLVCQCVVDRMGWTSRTFYDIRKTVVQGIPAGGDSKLLMKCRQDLKIFANKFSRVFALYDEDKVARLIQLTGRACRPAICKQLVEGCEPADKLEVVLLHRNTETVLKVIRDSGLTSIRAKVFAEAIQKRRHSRNMRDRVFTRCALELSVAARSRLLNQLPDMDRLVTRVALELEKEALDG